MEYQVKALIADDTKINRDVLSRILSDLGVEVIESENGAEAVEMVREHHPDIVFMDIRMPVMDGVEAAGRILAECGEDGLKLVAISASTLAHEQQRYLDAGFDSFISKPFRVEKICECLATLLNVEFERGEPAAEGPQQAEAPDVSLPEDLLEQLKRAASGYRMTELETHLNTMESLGSEGQRLAARLRELIPRYDMDAFIEILSEIQQSRKRTRD